MKKLLFFLLCASSIFAQTPPPPPASQAEVNAGILTRKYVSPATLSSYALLQSTGSISSAVATNIALNQVQVATNLVVFTNDTRSVSLRGALSLGGSNVASFATNLSLYTINPANGSGITLSRFGSGLLATDIGGGFLLGLSQNLVNLYTNLAAVGPTNYFTGSLSAGSLYLGVNGINSWDDVTNYFSLSGTTYTNNSSGLPGVIVGSGIGTNLSSLAVSTNPVLVGLTVVSNLVGKIESGGATNAAGSRVAYLSDVLSPGSVKSLVYSTGTNAVSTEVTPVDEDPGLNFFSDEGTNTAMHIGPNLFNIHAGRFMEFSGNAFNLYVHNADDIARGNSYGAPVMTANGVTTTLGNQGADGVGILSVVNIYGTNGINLYGPVTYNAGAIFSGASNYVNGNLGVQGAASFSSISTTGALSVATMNVTNLIFTTNWDASLGTNIYGSNIVSSSISNAQIAAATINSNKLDAATLSLLLSSANSWQTNLSIFDTNQNATGSYVKLDGTNLTMGGNSTIVMPSPVNATFTITNDTGNYYRIKNGATSLFEVSSGGAVATASTLNVPTAGYSLQGGTVLSGGFQQGILTVSNAVLRGTVTATNGYYLTTPTNNVTGFSAGQTILQPLGTFASLSFYTGTNTCAIRDGVYTNIAASSAYTDLVTNNWTGSATTGFITNNLSGWYRVGVGVSTHNLTANTGDEIEADLFVNETAQEKVSVHATLGGAGSFNTEFWSSVVYLPASSGLSFRVKGVGTTDSLQITHATITVGAP